MPDKPIWFQGIADSLLRKLEWWLTNYDKGDISRERDMLVGAEIKKVPVQYAHKLAWAPREIDFLVQIFEYYKPKAVLTEDLVKLKTGLKTGRLLPGGMYVTTLVFWKENVQDMVKLAREVRDGKSELDQFLAEKKPQSGMWKI